MVAIPAELPDDIQLLKELITLLRGELEKGEQLQEKLRQQISELARRLYGRGSEKVDPNQLQLVFDELLKLGLVEPEAQPEPEPAATAPAKIRQHRSTGRRPLPADLPRKRIVYDPREAGCSCSRCGGKQFVQIGEDISEQLEYQPASFLIIEHVRIKTVCAECEETVIIAPPALKPIAKGLPGPGLLAHVMTSKYVDHIPLHRLEAISARQGVELPRSTTCGWIGAGVETLEPIYEYCKQDVLKSKILGTDDTTVPVLDRSRETTRTGRLWVYIGDREHEHVVFDFTPNRERDGPLKFLEGFRGYLQADAYAGYDALYAGGEVIEIACWAHARRKFFEARQNYKKHAFTALALIKQLYDIERKGKDLSAEARQAMRQQHSVPILRAFEQWLLHEAKEVLPKSPLGKAMTYARLQWQALKRYVEDGALEIDNNRTERALRCVAIGRKNWLFAGSDQGGRRVAIIYSLVASCKLHDVDPFAYLRDVFSRLPSHRVEAIGELTPVAWAHAQRQLAAAA